MARLAVAWNRPMSEIESMSRREWEAMAQAYGEYDKARAAAEKRAERAAARKRR